MADSRRTEASRQLMVQLLHSSKYSDLVLSCKGRKFHVHRAIVCLQSSFLDKACSGEFKEAQTNKIDLDDDDPDTVERMISYMYTFDYKEGSCADSGSAQSQPSLKARATSTEVREDSSDDGSEDWPGSFSSVKVYAIADKYDIVALKELAKEKVSSWIETNWTHSAFPALVREIYECTPAGDRGLRDVVVRIMTFHAESILEQDWVRHLIQDIETLAFLPVLGQVTQSKAASAARIKALENELAAINASLTQQGLTKHQCYECHQFYFRQESSSRNHRYFPTHYCASPARDF